MQIVTMETPDGPRKMEIIKFFDFEGQTYAELVDLDQENGTILRREEDHLAAVNDETLFQRLIHHVESLRPAICPDCNLPMKEKHKRAKDCIRALSGVIAVLHRMLIAVGEQAITDPERFAADLNLRKPGGNGDVIPFRREAEIEST